MNKFKAAIVMMVLAMGVQAQDDFQINEGVSGAWFDPSTNGQGYFFEVLPQSKRIIVGWYTYDAKASPMGATSTIGGPNNRWMTALGIYSGNSFTADVLKTSGGRFDMSDVVENEVVGEMAITFTNCSTAELSYTLNDGDLANVINIQRISGENVDWCDALSDTLNDEMSDGE